MKIFFLFFVKTRNSKTQTDNSHMRIGGLSFANNGKLRKLVSMWFKFWETLPKCFKKAILTIITDVKHATNWTIKWIDRKQKIFLKPKQNMKLCQKQFRLGLRGLSLFATILLRQFDILGNNNISFIKLDTTDTKTAIAKTVNQGQKQQGAGETMPPWGPPPPPSPLPITFL